MSLVIKDIFIRINMKKGADFFRVRAFPNKNKLIYYLKTLRIIRAIPAVEAD